MGWEGRVLRVYTRGSFLRYGGILMLYLTYNPRRHVPWNKGKLIGQKPPFKLKEIWAIRIRLQLANRVRDLALFNLAIDSKLRGCDLVKLRVRDVSYGTGIAKRAMVMQQKTQQPVQFEITEQTRVAISSWVHYAGLNNDDQMRVIIRVLVGLVARDDLPRSPEMPREPKSSAESRRWPLSRARWPLPPPGEQTDVVKRDPLPARRDSTKAS